MGGDSQAERTQGRSGVIEILANIPKFFKIYLRDKKPPGKIHFTAIDAGTSIKAYLSYTAKKPDESNSDEVKQITHVPKPPLNFEICYSKVGRDNFFDYDNVYLGLHCDRDVKI